MIVKHYLDEKSLRFEFDEEIDHHTSAKLKERVDYEIERFMPKKVVLDFSSVNFMDSAGIGFVLGRYNKTQNYDSEFKIENVSKKIKDIFSMSGIQKIIDLE